MTALTQPMALPLELAIVPQTTAADETMTKVGKAAHCSLGEGGLVTQP